MASARLLTSAKNPISGIIKAGDEVSIGFRFDKEMKLNPSGFNLFLGSQFAVRGSPAHGSQFTRARTGNREL